MKDFWAGVRCMLFHYRSTRRVVVQTGWAQGDVLEVTALSAAGVDLV